jgi:hypothetical protein
VKKSVKSGRQDHCTAIAPLSRSAFVRAISAALRGRHHPGDGEVARTVKHAMLARLYSL